MESRSESAVVFVPSVFSREGSGNSASSPEEPSVMRHFGACDDEILRWAPLMAVGVLKLWTPMIGLTGRHGRFLSGS